MAGAGATLKKTALNNDGSGIQDFRQEILLNGLRSSPSTTSTTTPTTSTTISSTSTIEPYMSTPRTPIPKEFEWIRHTSTPQERRELIRWAVAAAREAEEADPDECMRLLDWSGFVYDTIADPPQVYDRHLIAWAHSTSDNAAHDEHKRLLKRAHSTARITAPGEHKRWSLQEEVTKPFEIAMKRIQREIKKKTPIYSYPGYRYPDSIQADYPRGPDLTQEHRIFSYKGEPGLYQCQNALWIWAELLDFLTSDEGPKYVGEKIKEKFPESDMIEERPSINELGFVSIKLSGKWIAKSLQKMLKDGIDTWAPKLPVERVIVAYPSLDEEVPVDSFRLLPIGYTIMSILKYSKVDVTIGHPMDLPKSFEWDGILASELLNRWFLCEEREEDVVIKGIVPFILQRRDFENAYKDIFALWYGLREHGADWIVYVTPLRQQVYIETCLAAAKLEGWISSDRHKPPRTSYAGCRSCNTEVKEKLLDEAKICSLAVSKGEAAKLLGYSAEAVFDCVFRYTSLMNHRLAVCTFDIKMFNEKGNTFVYLLNTQAQIRKITNAYRKDINELEKASELILEKDKGWEKGEERVLGFHLLEFTEALEECCVCVVPNVLCEYLYDLCKKFDSYHSSLCKDGSIMETSALLLYKATEVVMEKCFHLLGITSTPSLFGSSMTQLLSGLLFSTVERPIDVNARDPTTYSRFEMVSFRARPRVRYWYAQKGELFGLISVSDKSMQSRSHSFEPHITHVPLFNHDWRNPINMCNSGLIYLGNPGSGQPVSFSNFIEIHAEIFIRNQKECYQLCDQKKEIDLKNFWDTKEDGVCGELLVVTKCATIEMNCILIKDAIDTSVTVQFTTKPDTPRLVHGYIQAYYGDEFLYKCKSGSICKEAYMVLLFRAAPSFELKPGDIPLIRSCLAVPTKGRLIIKAYLVDVNSNKVIVNGTAKFKPVFSGHSRYIITGFEDCSLDVEVCWDYRS